MVKKLTIKDFIRYNSPCKSCGARSQLFINYYETAEMTGVSHATPPTGSVKTFILNGRICTDLQITYKHSLRLSVVPESNMYFVNNAKAFRDFIKRYTVYCQLHCPQCKSYLSSSLFEFTQTFLKPISVVLENIFIKFDTYDIVLGTNQIKSQVHLVQNRGTQDNSLIKLPPTPLSDFKNREELVQKMKFLLTFS